LTLGNGVTNLATSTFFACTNLPSVTIPDTVTMIGTNAFLNCYGLTNLTLGNSVTNIAFGAFNNCSNLPSVTIPNSVKSIGNSAFASCTNLSSLTIGNSVTSIGNTAFAGCAITNLTIPASVTSIGTLAFNASAKLSTVNFLQSSPPTVAANSFTGVASGAVGFYPAAASVAWSGATVSGLTLMAAGTLPAVTFSAPASLTYDGTGKAYTATASRVSGFSYSYRGRNSTTYGPSDVSPANAGDYTVTATSTDSIFTGSAQQDFTITQAPATVTVSNLSQVYNGSPRPITVTTVPANLAVSVQYNGGTTVPTNAGSYPVQVTVTDANYTGSKSEVLTVAKADLLLSSLPTASAITYGQTLAD
ncbi:MAG: leucine-rich repeat domain-containing protein, partial [Verrucomicrobia bacterium]|nr:leucine-rich repeat domain-containing protein [Verrucomicrobiota bacterium]